MNLHYLLLVRWLYNFFFFKCIYFTSTTIQFSLPSPYLAIHWPFCTLSFMCNFIFTSRSSTKLLNYASSSPSGNFAGNIAKQNPSRYRPQEWITWSATLLPKVISEWLDQPDVRQIPGEAWHKGLLHGPLFTNRVDEVVPDLPCSAY